MWLREIFSDDNGRGSMTRVCLILVVLAILVCCGWSTYKTGVLPNPPDNLVALVCWLTGTFIAGTTVTKGVQAYGAKNADTSTAS